MHRNIELVQAELNWLIHLNKNKTNVYVPIYSNNNSLTEVVNPSSNEKLIGVVFKKVIGNHLKGNYLSSAIIEKFGQSVGRLHKNSSNYDYTKEKHQRFTLFQSDFNNMRNTVLPIKYLLDDKKMQKKINELELYSKFLSTSNSNFGLIHGDLQASNLLLKDGEIFLIDFDDCSINWFSYDIVIALTGAYYWYGNKINRENYISFLISFLNGYSLEHTFDKNWLKHFNYFLSLRRISLYLHFIRRVNFDNAPKNILSYLSCEKKSILSDEPLINIDFSTLTL